MLKLNGVNLEDIAENSQNNDIRLNTDWAANDHRFIVPVNLFNNSTIKTTFKQNSIPWNIAARGTRPILKINPNPPVYTEADVPKEVTQAGLDVAWFQEYNQYIDKYFYRLKEMRPGTYYLIKFSDKTVRWCTKQQLYTESPDASSIIIANAEEDIKTLLIEFVGGGGGGAPGGWTLCGTGGGSGAYVFAALNIEHPLIGDLPQNTFPITVGGGGRGGVFQQGGTTGGALTGINTASHKLIAHGGTGGSDTSQAVGRGGTVEKTANLDQLIVPLVEVHGIDGNAKKATQKVFNTDFVAPNESISLDRPVQPASPDANSGGGGGTPLGFGAEGVVGRKNGWTGPHPGVGASGGGWYHNGGNGAFGCILIYY